MGGSKEGCRRCVLPPLPARDDMQLSNITGILQKKKNKQTKKRKQFCRSLVVHPFLNIILQTFYYKNNKASDTLEPHEPTVWPVLMHA